MIDLPEQVVEFSVYLSGGFQKLRFYPEKEQIWNGYGFNVANSRLICNTILDIAGLEYDWDSRQIKQIADV